MTFQVRVFSRNQEVVGGKRWGKVGVHITCKKIWVLNGADLLIVRFLQFHQKKRRNQDLLKEFKVYEVSGCGHTSNLQ